MTPQLTISRMVKEKPHWRVPLMDFVDEVRRQRDVSMIAEPFAPADPNLDAMLASMIEHLCYQLGWDPPAWLQIIPPAPRAWFISGIQNLKAIALAESPPSFRIRRIFVLESFLTRV